MQIVFLGTGGGRFVTTLQMRHTGGIRLNGEKAVHIDPGPGALIRSLHHKQDPRKIDVLCVSHQHMDHFNDAPVMIEAMTEGTRKKRGVLICGRKLLEGDGEDTPAIAKYHRNLMEKSYACGAGEEIRVDGLTIATTPTVHAEKYGIGFHFREWGLGYAGDTSVNDEIIKAHKGAKILIINLIAPERYKRENIMTVADAKELLLGANPKQAIVTHFGMRVLREGPEKLAAEIEKDTGIPTTAAKDGMVFDTEAPTLG